MLKLFVLIAVAICAVNAGIIGGYGIGHGAVIAAAPAVHVAESYQNSNQISLHPTPIIVSHAAPVITKVAAAPVLYASHGLSYGGHGLGLH
ncbi:cuticle protein 63-like [Coccinella septempunctata]|uniref:cuticle protein 63-like n=1 Tax=Coccinella septempunctata TaxID=41139 RepID=UPI001D05EB38|nr:cuticle protein 63-like [Coccinella septempunctata]